MLTDRLEVTEDVPEVPDEDDDSFPVLEQVTELNPYTTLRDDVQSRCILELFPGDHSVFAERDTRRWRISSRSCATVSVVALNFARQKSVRPGGRSWRSEVKVLRR